MPQTLLGEKRLAGVEARLVKIQEMLPRMLAELRELRRLSARQVPPMHAALAKSLREARTQAEREYFIAIGDRCGWNRSQMARSMGIDRKGVHRGLHKFGLTKVFGSRRGGRVGASGRARGSARR